MVRIKTNDTSFPSFLHVKCFKGIEVGLGLQERMDEITGDVIAVSDRIKGRKSGVSLRHRIHNLSMSQCDVEVFRQMFESLISMLHLEIGIIAHHSS